VHARTFFPKRFVVIENKGAKIQLPKLVVRSIPVARANFSQTKNLICWRQDGVYTGRQFTVSASGNLNWLANQIGGQLMAKSNRQVFITWLGVLILLIGMALFSVGASRSRVTTAQQNDSKQDTAV
jgi:hypothetical protein